jgi:hypothetical protein
MYKVLLFLNISIGCFAQTIYSINIEIQDWKVDPMDQLIIVNPQQEILKLSNSGNIIQRFSKQSLGKITSIDVKNPLITIVFYKNLQSLILLDNTFNIMGEIELNELDFMDVTLIDSGPDKSIWIYDSGYQKFFKINRNGKIEFESSPLSLFFRNIPKFEKLWVTTKGIFLYDQYNGITQFDFFGKWLKSFPVPAVVDIESFSDFFYFRSLEGLFKITLPWMEVISIELDMNYADMDTKIKLGENMFFVSSKDHIKAFKYEN